MPGAGEPGAGRRGFGGPGPPIDPLGRLDVPADAGAARLDSSRPCALCYRHQTRARQIVNLSTCCGRIWTVPVLTTETRLIGFKTYSLCVVTCMSRHRVDTDWGRPIPAMAVSGERIMLAEQDEERHDPQPGRDNDGRESLVCKGGGSGRRRAAMTARLAFYSTALSSDAKTSG